MMPCGSCFDGYEDFYICIGVDKIAKQFKEADCVLSDGKCCSERLFDGIANGDIHSCDDEDDACITTCKRSSQFE